MASDGSNAILNEEQRQLMELKRQEALRKRKLKEDQATRASRWRKQADTHGGFFVDDGESEAELANKATPSRPFSSLLEMEPLPPDILPELSQPKCNDCGQEFYESLLRKQFAVNVCDACRRMNEDGKYSLVTKTEARQEYLLTETDLDASFGGLRCIEKKNPQNERWGMMKLYLRGQVEKICFDRYGGEQGLDEEIVRRSKEKLVNQEKKQKRKVAQMRKETLTSLWRKPDKAHEHHFGPEEAKDGGLFVKRCEECDFEVEFEKMWVSIYYPFFHPFA